MTNYIISSNEPGKMGGSKAKEDIINYTKMDGFKSFRVNPYQPNKLAKFCYVHFELAKFFRKNRDIDNVIIQYPIPSQYIIEKLFNKLKSVIKGKIVIWVHDIQGLQISNLKEINWEIKFFNNADVLVVHNSRMKTWLKNHGINVRMIVLEIFDYDNSQPIQPDLPFERTVCFAGNLFKSEFLKKINIQTKLFVYGPNMPSKHSGNVIPMGQFSPEEITKHLNQNFGLIWDGPSEHSCEGTFGRYLLYNNPHKTSLYISSGIPIIIWDKAAVSEFIIKNKIGITISDLTKLDRTLCNISKEEYQVMKENVVRLAKNVRTGYYTHRVISEILK